MALDQWSLLTLKLSNRPFVKKGFTEMRLHLSYLFSKLKISLTVNLFLLFQRVLSSILPFYIKCSEVLHFFHFFSDEWHEKTDWVQTKEFFRFLSPDLRRLVINHFVNGYNSTSFRYFAKLFMLVFLEFNMFFRNFFTLRRKIRKF